MSRIRRYVRIWIVGISAGLLLSACGTATSSTAPTVGAGPVQPIAIEPTCHQEFVEVQIDRGIEGEWSGWVTVCD